MHVEIQLSDWGIIFIKYNKTDTFPKNTRQPDLPLALPCGLFECRTCVAFGDTGFYYKTYSVVEWKGSPGQTERNSRAVVPHESKALPAPGIVGCSAIQCCAFGKVVVEEYGRGSGSGVRRTVGEIKQTHFGSRERKTVE